MFKAGAPSAQVTALQACSAGAAAAALETSLRRPEGLPPAQGLAATAAEERALAAAALGTLQPPWPAEVPTATIGARQEYARDVFCDASESMGGSQFWTSLLS